jgi:hypothetical protein
VPTLTLLAASGVIALVVRSAEPQPPQEKPDQPKPQEKAEQPNPQPKNEEKSPDAEASPGHELALAPPPFSKGMFPCSGCHEDLEPNPTRRTLVKNHKNIVLKHDEQHRWCLDCHNLKDRDRLHLASGQLVEFTESYKLCGQCHGPTLRDWKAGEHGKRTGSWSGKKQYLLCANCHNPHSPRFQPLKPLPAPVRPAELR